MERCLDIQDKAGMVQRQGCKYISDTALFGCFKALLEAGQDSYLHIECETQMHLQLPEYRISESDLHSQNPAACPPFLL
jgi:hypothetical protein